MRRWIDFDRSPVIIENVCLFCPFFWRRETEHFISKKNEFSEPPTCIFSTINKPPNTSVSRLFFKRWNWCWKMCKKLLGDSFASIFLLSTVNFRHNWKFHPRILIHFFFFVSLSSSLFRLGRSFGQPILGEIHFFHIFFSRIDIKFCHSILFLQTNSFLFSQLSTWSKLKLNH